MSDLQIKPKGEPIPDEELEKYLVEFSWADQATAKYVVESLREAGYVVDVTPADELIGKVLTVRRAKVFKSAYPGTDFALYCEVEVEGEEHRIGTVLGGEVVMEKLSMYFSAVKDHPPKFRLIKKAGGRFNGYYDLE